ncbi:MAG: hypothetical protein AB1522_00555 [Chloroflexota bacterium]
MNHPQISTIGLWVGIILILVTGCTPVVDGGQPVEITPTVFIPADLTNDGLAITPGQACLLQQAVVIQTDRPMGDFLAWSGEGNLLAFITPINDSWGWYEGDLVVMNVSNGERQRTKDVRVAGDLTWSPGGSQIAFVTLRPAEAQYSIGVYSLSDDRVIDLYEVAVTDEFSSRKGIVGWRSEQVLRVSESCGIDCVRIVDHNLSSGTKTTVEEIRLNEDTSLQIALNQPGVVPNNNWRNANWSPDGGRVFFTDRTNVSWIGDFSSSTKSALPLEPLPVQESKWSPDGQWIAVRTAENVFVFSLSGCR